MSRRAPAVQYGARPSSRHSPPGPGSAPRTRTATRPDPDLSTSAVPSAGPAPAVTDTLQVRPIARLAACTTPARRLGRTGGSGRGRFCEGGSRDDSGQDESQLGGAAEHRMMVGVQGNGRGLRECGYPFCHVCGEDRVPLADHVRCGFLPISGRAQRLANRARRVRTQSRDRAVRHSWGALAEEERARVIRHDALAVFGEDPPFARLSTENVEHARAGGHRERAHMDHVGDILTSRSHLGDRHITV